MTLSHGDLAVDHDVIGVVDDPVNYRFGDGTAVIRFGIDAVIPALGVVLCAEYHRTRHTGFDDLQQINALTWREFADKPLVKDKQIDLFVCLDDLGKLIVRSCNCKLVKQFR